MALQSGVTIVTSVSFPKLEDTTNGDVLTLVNGTDQLLLMSGSNLSLMN